MNQRKYINTLKKTPPQCVKNYVVNPDKKLEEYLKNQIEDIQIYGIKCACGSTKFHIKGEQNITLICEECSTHITIFNYNKDGYDAVITEHVSENLEDVPENVKCTNCNNEVFEIAVGFEYSVSEEEAKEIISDLSLKGTGEEELFTWFIVSGKCISCKEITTLVDIECA